MRVKKMIEKRRNKLISSDRILFDNNSRKMSGLPLRRKTNKKKRFYTRCKADEALDALLEYWND